MSQINPHDVPIGCRLAGGDRLVAPANGDWSTTFEFRGLTIPGFRIVLDYIALSTDRSGGAPTGHAAQCYFSHPAKTLGVNTVLLLNETSITDWVSTNGGAGWPVPSAGGNPWSLFLSSSAGGSVVSAFTFGWSYERTAMVGDMGWPG